jgi:hypothetical protein
MYHLLALTADAPPSREVCGAASPVLRILADGMPFAPFRLSVKDLYQAVSNCSNMTSEEQQ